MPERAIYPVRRGDPHVSLIAAALGESIAGLTLAADIYHLPGGRGSYTPGALAASYVVTAFPGDVAIGPGFYLSAETSGFEPGIYLCVPYFELDFAPVAIPPQRNWLLEVTEK
jgi:hypothetical protein